MRFLIIEDNPDNAYLVRFLLEKRGHAVERAADGPTGLRLAADGQFDGVLLDIQLPGMDGYEAARRLKALPRGERVPVVALTSFAMAGDRELALSSGCDFYVEKPIRPESFVDEIETMIQEGTGGAHPDR